MTDPVEEKGELRKRHNNGRAAEKLRRSQWLSKVVNRESMVGRTDKTVTWNDSNMEFRG